MPEMLEIERYRRLAAAAVGRRIERVLAPDAWFLKGGATPDTLRLTLTGATVEGIRRHGKLLLVDTDGGATLGLRFGMTGRLFVDGVAGIAELEYGSNRIESAWVRFSLLFDRGDLAMHDPRRLGGVELEPDTARLGPDAWTLTPQQLHEALRGGQGPLKARLLDQSRIAGLGNLLVDESLWRARLAPTRPAGSLDDAESARLHAAIGEVVVDLDRRGGSHTGDLQPARTAGASCPRCGAAIGHGTVGGRSTYWCGRCVTNAGRHAPRC